jgi:replicative DNA helicase
VVLLLHREELYDQYSNKKNILDVFFAKNRQGRTGAGELYFEKPIFTMRNMKEVSESDKMNMNNQDEQKSF